jgi:sodium/bile acid cotransporter 7
MQLLKKRWFLLMLLVLISGGMAAGAWLPADRAQRLGTAINPSVVTGIVLFLMSFSLDGERLGASFRAPGPVLWASVVNLGAVPLLAWPLMQAQLTPDFAFGLMIAGSVPCTLAAVSVWTRKAGGNDAVSLLATVVTNGACFLVTPFWLGLATPARVSLDAASMIGRLAAAVLLPAVLGQALRTLPVPARISKAYKIPIGVLAQIFILSILFSAACNAGTQLHRLGAQASGGGLFLVWISCVAVHVIAMLIGMAGSRAFGFERDDRIAVAFASSQKTLPVGLLIATDPTMFGNPNLLGPGEGVPFALFPMLLFHVSQLFIDTAVADRFAAARREAPGAQPSEKPVEGAADV